jgi:hypothetical protein
MSMLSIKGLRSGYGKIEVLHDVILDIVQDNAAQDHLRPAAPGRRQHQLRG